VQNQRDRRSRPGDRARTIRPDEDQQPPARGPAFGLPAIALAAGGAILGRQGRAGLGTLGRPHLPGVMGAPLDRHLAHDKPQPLHAKGAPVSASVSTNPFSHRTHSPRTWPLMSGVQVAIVVAKAPRYHHHPVGGRCGHSLYASPLHDYAGQLIDRRGEAGYRDRQRGEAFRLITARLPAAMHG
jgi:hypothetical protein